MLQRRASQLASAPRKLYRWAVRGRASGSDGRRRSRAAAPAEEVVIIRDRVPDSCTLLEAVQSLAGLDQQAAERLLHLGAVYYGQQIKGQDVLKWRRAVRHQADPGSMQLAAGQWVRVHPRPKRFPACHQADWPSRVVYEDAEFLVVNKPANLPSMGHESNCLEHLAPCVAAGLGCGALQVCHRLDQWTTGLIVLAKQPAALARFHRALEARAQMVKIYKVLTWQPLQPGPLEHWVYDGPWGESVPVVKGRPLWARGPRLLSQEALPGWKLCQLEVLDCWEAPEAAAWWRQQQLLRKGGDEEPRVAAAAAAGGGGGGLVYETVYESSVLLLTGRTHQIRAQCAAVGRPLLGDAMYGPMAGLLVGSCGELGDSALGQLEGVAQLEGPIGLHAWQLEWEGRSLRAPAPWHL